ncbi:MAG: AMP-binding protein, partial [Prevotella sp.]|nr:AMP-binding protein [Prevotella sp.]
MVERFLKQTTFTSVEDYNKNLEFIIPEHFNFAYDVMDAWAEEKPDGLALLWTDDTGAERRTTFSQLKQETDQAASYLQTLGIAKGDPVMLILKRRYEWWVVMLALHKLGAVVIPATHMLTKHDIIYRNTRASVKAIICVDDAYVTAQISAALPESPTVETIIVVSEGSETPGSTGFSGKFHSWHQEWLQAPPFQRPAHANDNDDTMLMYFTSGTSGEPKMVAHDFLYAMGHLTTGVFWHNLHEGSLHLTVADTGWGKAVWGKFYGQWFAGATVFVFDHEKFNADTLLRQIEK